MLYHTILNYPIISLQVNGLEFTKNELPLVKLYAFSIKSVMIVLNASVYIKKLQVTFVFTNQVDGKLVPIESKVNPRMLERGEGSKSQNIGKAVKVIEREGNKMQNTFKQNLDSKSKFLSKHHKLLNSVSSSSSRNSLRITSSIPFQGQIVNSMTTSLRGAGLSLGNQLPLKRSSSASVKHDDDFQ